MWSASPFTPHVGLDHGLRRAFRRAMAGARWVFHTATLHKPHVATHSRQEFVDVNVTGTLNLLEEASAAGVEALVCTSTTSTFGDALVPPAGEPAAWITEAVRPVPTNIYGVTKTAAEVHLPALPSKPGPPCVVHALRASSEEDEYRPSALAWTTPT